MSKDHKKTIFEIIILLLPLLVAYIMFAKIIMIAVVQSGSMEPTLNVGNTVFYNRLAYVNSSPKRGDVVIMWSDETNCLLGKRVIGIGGDTVRFVDGRVVINDQFIDESAYLSSNIHTISDKTFAVPKGYFFMLGDNRESSIDARFWKNPFIPLSDIKGKYLGQIGFSVQYDILHDY